MKKTINILFKHDNPGFNNRIGYVLNFIEQHPLTDGRVKFSENEGALFDLKLYYGIEQTDAFYIPSQKVVFSNVLPQYDTLIANQYTFGEMYLYAFEQKRKPQQDFISDNHFHFDIFETIFFHISRFEEWFYQFGRSDEHGRMDARQQFLVKNNLHRKPVVDHLIFGFLNAIGIETRPMKTTFRITHDIDFIVKKNNLMGVVKSMGGAILKRQNIPAAIRIWKNRGEKNPYDTFDWMLRKEENIEKVIYFLVGGKTRFDEPYDLHLRVFKKAIELCKERGYQIGIHPSYNTWKDEALLQKEWKKLEQAIGKEIVLTRQHFLRFSFKDTPQIIQQLGFKEDSSLGYADRIGFRCGTGFAYRLYDFDHERAFDFLEVPLVFMDSALFAEADFQPEQIRKIWAAFLSENRFNTKITFNFHNSRFYDARIQNIPLRELYEGLFEKTV